MSELRPADVREMTAALDLAPTDEDITEVTHRLSGGGAGAKRSSENERSVKQRFCPVYALCSTHDLVRDVYASFGYGPDAIPFWNGPQEHFEFPGR